MLWRSFALFILTLGMIVVTLSGAVGLEEENAWPWNIHEHIMHYDSADGWANWAERAGMWLVAPIAFVSAYVLWGVYSASYSHWRTGASWAFWLLYPTAACLIMPPVVILGEWTTYPTSPMSVAEIIEDFRMIASRVALLLAMGALFTATGMIGVALTGRIRQRAEARKFAARLRRARQRRNR